MSRRAASTRLEALTLLLVSALATLALLPLSDPRATPAQWDEFILLANAKRVFAGAVPYLDYVNFAPPGADWAYAGLFALIGGPNAGAARLLAHLVAVLTALSVYLALRRLAARRLDAATPALFFLALFYPLWSIPLHHWTALLPASAALLLGAIALTATGARAALTAALGAGLLTVASALCAQTDGLIIAATLVALPFLAGRLERLRHLAIGLGGGLLLGALCLLLYLLLSGSLLEFVDASVLFPLSQYRQEGSPNAMPLLGDLGVRLEALRSAAAPLWVRALLLAAAVAVVVVLAALVATTLALAGLWLRSALRERQPRAVWGGAAFVLPLGAALVCFLVRPDVLHAVFYGLFPAAALALRLSPRAPSSSTAGWASRGYRALAALCVAVGLLGNLGSPWLQGGRVPAVFGRASTSDPLLAGLPPVDAEMVRRDVRLQLLRGFGATYPGATLFAAPRAGEAYFLGLPPAVPDTLIYPPGARYSGEREYGRALAHLEQRPAELVMFSPAATAASFLQPPDHSGDSARALAELLGRSYRPIGQVGDALFLIRHDLSWPPAGPPGSPRARP